jgi:predicted nucleic acid-binding protein
VVVVDSSIWIDFYRGHSTNEVSTLKKMMWRGGEVIVGDLILAEVLQGANSHAEFAKIQSDMSVFDQLTISSSECAISAAKNFRHLRAKGITIRKTIDTLIATRCIMDKIPLLYSDRDFDPFVEHLGLIPAVRA